MAEIWILIGFHIFILALLAVDLGVFQREAHEVTWKGAAAWSTVWLILALLFAAGIWASWHLWHTDQQGRGASKAVEFVTGYLIELSLSVDNLFVFLVIFRYFGVREAWRRRVLVWGIVGAIIMRAVFVLAGVALLHLFEWVIYVFGAFLLYTGYKLARSMEEKIDPGKNTLVRLASRWLPIAESQDQPRFFVKREGRWHATSLLLVLLVVESTDVAFAVDSIPAIFGVTRDPFIVYTSNIFAILGLRSLYFLLAHFLGRFRYLNIGLAVVLAFVGLKMIVEEACKSWLQEHGVEEIHLILLSLGVIAAVLTTAILLSVVRGPVEPLEHPPEAPQAAPIE